MKRQKKYGYFILSEDGTIQGMVQDGWNSNEYVISPNTVTVSNSLVKHRFDLIKNKIQKYLKKNDKILFIRVSRTSTTLPIYIDFKQFNEKKKKHAGTVDVNFEVVDSKKFDIV